MIRDPSEFTLSPKQKDLFTGWKRPGELLARDGKLGDQESLGASMTASLGSDLVQDMVTDCSVVASLSAAMRHLAPKKDSVSLTLVL
jgi:hypothetical protein